LQATHYPGCILLLEPRRKALGEHVPQTPDLFRILGDGPGLPESKGVAGTHSFHGLEGSFRRDLLGHSLKRLVDDGLCWKPSFLGFQDNGLRF